MSPRTVFRTLGIAFVLAAAAACATPPADPGARAEFDAVNDPFEPLNRAVFRFNVAVDDALIRPAAVVYRAVVPDPGQIMVHNFLTNLEAPVVFANDVLQGESERAAITLSRFLMNSTIGFGGFLDPATYAGLERHNEDFGQTVAVWGAGDGAYLMLPLFGPSSPRDTAGLIVDHFLDPFAYIVDDGDHDEWFSVGRLALSAVDLRARHLEELDEIERTSIDFYATVRTLYRQRRAAEIRNGALPPDSAIPAITFEDEAGADGALVRAAE
ncbi:MAG: VacJ family lipoprotein [Alphaproteobacteria bacterium]|nr:VacJ family lipoprotein [Alphaproteobacteria bacterium]